MTVIKSFPTKAVHLLVFHYHDLATLRWFLLGAVEKITFSLTDCQTV